MLIHYLSQNHHLEKEIYLHYLEIKKNTIKALRNLLINNLRTKNIVKHTVTSFFFKSGAVLANFAVVPITIDYLDTQNYGVWLTISSFIAWFTFFDIGLGNGLRNKLSEALANKNFKLAKAYISSAYFTITFISLLLFVFFFTINHFVDWKQLFNIHLEVNINLSLLMIIIFGCFCLQLILNLISNIYLANQHHSIQVKIHLIIQVLSLLFIWILTESPETSLMLFAIIFSALPVIVLFILNIVGFSTKYNHLKPSFSLWKKRYVKDIMGIGFSFFLVQLAGIILFSTDNFIIARIFNPEEVVPYNIAFKYFSIVTMIFTLILTPYWSSFTEAFMNKEYNWIKKSIKNLLKVWLIIPLLLFGMIYISNFFYEFWIDDDVLIPFTLTLSMAFFAFFYTFNMIFVFFLNGVGKIKIQLIVSLVSMVVNIPLSIYFAKNLDMGLAGVILATTVSIAVSAVLSPIQYFKIINLKANGIWGK